MRFPHFAVALAVTPFTAQAADFPKFKMQEIDTGLSIGYAVLTVDVDGDKKLDIVVVDKHKLVWYQNPGKPGAEWKKRIILDDKTKPDNVCCAAIDIDGDGLPSSFWVRTGSRSTRRRRHNSAG
ncbi:MAG: VCBS repeat-containing protein [Gemmataceae bacterium]